MTNEELSGLTSGLYYYDTDIEVRLGDRVRLRRFLRKPLDGVVCYIPGLSPVNNQMEDGSVREWAIRHPDGWITTIIYLPEKMQPTKNIEFVRRGEVGNAGVSAAEEFQ